MEEPTRRNPTVEVDMNSSRKDISVFQYSHVGYIPPVTREQLEQLLTWSLTGLPHRVDTLTNGEAVIHLSSGRSVRITPSVRDGEDSAHLDVVVHEIEQADVPEMMAVHANLVENTIFAARVLWARQNAAA
jgi:hypothetical protein